jgi:hypothetical protein
VCLRHDKGGEQSGKTNQAQAFTLNCRIAFRLRSNISPFAIARDPFALVLRRKNRPCATQPLPGPQKHNLHYFEALGYKLHHQHLSSVQTPPFQTDPAGSAKPPSAAAYFQTSSALDGSPPAAARSRDMLTERLPGLHQALLQAGQRRFRFFFSSTSRHRLQVFCDHARAAATPRSTRADLANQRPSTRESLLAIKRNLLYGGSCSGLHSLPPLWSTCI